MKKTELGLALMDALCAGMLSAGAALVLLPLMGVPAPYIFLAVCIPLLLGLFAAAEKRPWVPPAVLAAAGLTALAAAALGGDVYGYILQAWEDTVNGSVNPLIFTACLFPIALISRLAVRLGNRFRRWGLWTAVLLYGGLIGYKAVFMPEGWLAPFLLLSAGLILFLPRATLGEKGRLQAQVLSAALALPVLGLAVLLGPWENGQWRSQAVGYLVQDAQDFWVYHWGELPPLPVTSMRSMGLQPQKDSLGGDRELSDRTVLTGSQNLLLRGQALDCYTGSGWEDAAGEDMGNFRFDSLFWQGRRSDAFGLGLPRDTGGRLLDELLTEVDADLRTVRNFRSLFLPYRAEKVEAGKRGDDLYFNMQGEAYWSRAQEQSVAYHVTGRTWNYRDEDFDKNMLLLEKIAGHAGEDGGPGWDGQCLQLPETLPGWVNELAADLTAESGSQYAKAMALRDWLSRNCRYTLTPGPADPEQDFVAGFLTGRRGYCTYYASALTVLCRCAGVPARYVTGYGMTADGGRYKATQATAHAWTEIYLENIGWVPLDALSQDIFAQETPLPEESQAGGGASGPQATPVPTPSGEAGWAPGSEQEQGGFDPLLLLWAAPVFLAAAAFFTARALRSRRYRPEYVRRKFPGTDRAAGHCYAGLLRLLRILELHPEPGETLLAFWQRAAGRLPKETDWQEVGRIMDRLRFGGVLPERGEADFLCRCYGELERCIRESRDFVKWMKI